MTDCHVFARIVVCFHFKVIAEDVGHLAHVLGMVTRTPDYLMLRCVVRCHRVHRIVLNRLAGVDVRFDSIGENWRSSAEFRVHRCYLSLRWRVRTEVLPLRLTILLEFILVDRFLLYLLRIDDLIHLRLSLSC